MLRSPVVVPPTQTSSSSMQSPTSASSWIQACSAQLAGHRLENFVIETLQCFDAPFPRSNEPPTVEPEIDDSLQSFSEAHESAFEELARGSWQQEVDPAVAGLFERRLQSVDTLLGALPDALVAKTLRLGLRVRMRQIMQRGIWPAIRLRALADFYYSRSVLLMHNIDSLDTELLKSQAERTTWQPVNQDGTELAGVWESHYDGDGVWGPQQIRALKIDLRTYRLETFDLRSENGSHDALAERLGALGAVAGSSGGFFLYSEPDIESPSAQYDPVGMILDSKNISHPPIESRAALLFADSTVELRRVGLGDVALFWQDTELPLSCAIHRSASNIGPAATCISVIGSLVHEVGENLAVPLNGFLLPWQDTYGPLPSAGTRLRWQGPKMQSGALAQEGLSGGPLLLLDGEPCIDFQAEGFWGSAAPLTFSQDETGDRNLLARLVVGTDLEGFFYMVAIDGRQADRALGLSLEGCAAWMQGLGCDRAANMDGGSSKRLMLLGEVMDAPTTEVAPSASGESRTRPVYSGLAVIPKREA